MDEGLQRTCVGQLVGGGPLLPCGSQTRTQVTTADPTAGTLNPLNHLTSSQSVLSILTAVRICVLPPLGGAGGRLYSGEPGGPWLPAWLISSLGSSDLGLLDTG